MKIILKEVSQEPKVTEVENNLQLMLSVTQEIIWCKKNTKKR